MRAGRVPCGGPKEIVELARVGFIYSTIEELCELLKRLLPSFDDPLVTRQMTKRMIGGADPFSKARQRQKIERLMTPLTAQEIATYEAKSTLGRAKTAD
jgi:hypothetical protein